MLHLMNSAMMPRAGFYLCSPVTPIAAKAIFIRANGAWKSYIGYPNSCQILSELFGASIPMSHENTVIEHGDELLAMRLRYRLNLHSKRNREHGRHLEDYDFFLITFSEVACNG